MVSNIFYKALTKGLNLESIKNNLVAKNPQFSNDRNFTDFKSTSLHSRITLNANKKMLPLLKNKELESEITQEAKI